MTQKNQSKQFQHRLGTRAPHGSPEFSARVGTWVTPKQHLKVKQRGGSAWLRKIIDEAA